MVLRHWTRAQRSSADQGCADHFTRVVLCNLLNLVAFNLALRDQNISQARLPLFILLIRYPGTFRVR